MQGVIVWGSGPDLSALAAIRVMLAGLLAASLVLVGIGAALLVVVQRRRAGRSAHERALLALGEARGRQRVLDEVRMLAHGQLKAHVLAVQQCIEQARTSMGYRNRQQWLDDASEQIHRLLEVIISLHRATGDSALPGDFEQVLVDVTTSLALAYPTCACHVAVTGQRLRPLPDALQRTLTLVLYNALTNAFTHARPSHILVELRYAPDVVLLVIADNGCWDARDAGRCSGRGLHDMRELTAALGGTIVIDSDQQTGTWLTVTLPLLQGAVHEHDGGRHAALFQPDSSTY
jgi:glucose-6-phosphate-specific signal transduction histidine kinase